LFSAPFLLAAFIAGYLFTRNFVILTYKLHNRYNSLIQYLYVALFSIIPVSIATVIYTLASYFEFHPIEKYFPYFYNLVFNVFCGREENNAHLLSIILIAIIAGWIPYKIIFEKLLDWIKPNSERKLKRIISLRKTVEKVSLFDSLMLKSKMLDMPICVTLSDNKVYVGYIRETLDFTTIRNDIGLTPLLSGYRDESTKRIIFTTRYDEVSKILNSNNSVEINDSLEIFQKIIPFKEIKTLNLFDATIYSDHFAHKSRKKK